MQGTNHAILIGNSEFPNEPLLATLRCPINDIQSMEEVLACEKHGPYTVQMLPNWNHHAIQLAILQTLKKATSEDKVLIYYAGHGKINNDDSSLYLAAANTNVEYLSASAVSVAEITKQMKYSASKQLILVLDCCYSGAIDKLMSPDTMYRGDADQVGMNFRQSLGTGTYVLTACSSLQRAAELEGDSNGLLTKHLVQGIRDGVADRNDDGLISMHELTTYVQEQVKREGHQTPSYFSFGEAEGGLVIAKSGKPARSRKVFEVQEAIYEAALARRATLRTTRAALALLVPDQSTSAATRSACNDFVDRLHNHLADPRAITEILEEAYGLAHDLLILPSSIRQELEQQRDAARAEAATLQATLEAVQARTHQVDLALQSAHEEAAENAATRQLQLGQAKRSAQQQAKLREDFKQLQKETNDLRSQRESATAEVEAAKKNLESLGKEVLDLQLQQTKDQQRLRDALGEAFKAKASAITEAEVAQKSISLLTKKIDDLQIKLTQDQKIVHKAAPKPKQVEPVVETTKKKPQPRVDLVKSITPPSLEHHAVDPALLPALKAIQGTIQTMVDRESAVMSVLLGYTRQPGFWVSPNLPDSKVAGAKTRFYMAVDEKILGLIDCTVFGSAKDSVLFGHRTMYWYNLGTSGVIAYKNLATATLCRAVAGITINGEKLSINGSGFSCELFFDMVTELKKIGA